VTGKENEAQSFKECQFFTRKVALLPLMDMEGYGIFGCRREPGQTEVSKTPEKHHLFTQKTTGRKTRYG
jgi:hypothetical protein